MSRPNSSAAKRSPRRPSPRRPHRRWSRRAWTARQARRAALGLAAAAAGVGVVVWQSGDLGAGGADPASSAAAGGLMAPPPPGPLGPEGVPVPRGPALAGPGGPTPGTQVDGISCGPLEQIAFHVHAHLTIFVSGSQRRVPAGVGIGAPRNRLATPVGTYVAGGSCFSWLHTHAADGIVHIESPVQRAYTLGNFFDVWKQPLGPSRLGSATGQVTAFLDGRRYRGNPRDIPLSAHAQIQIDIGRPTVAPESIRFPPGL